MFLPPPQRNDQMDFDDNISTRQEILAAYEAIRDSNCEEMNSLIISKNLIDAHWDLSAIGDIPDALKRCPPAISIAAYFSNDSYSFLLANGASLKIPDKFGRLPVHFILRNGDEQQVMSLQEQEIDFNIPDKGSRRPIHYAALGGNEFAIKWLWTQGVDIDAQDKFGFTPLMFAAKNGNKEIVEFLINNGCDPTRIFSNKNGKRNLVCFACESNSPETLSYLLEKNLDAEFVSFDGPPLIIAAKYGNAELIPILLNHGVIPNSYDMNGTSAIMWAAKNGLITALPPLLQANANINKQNKFGETALSLALDSNQFACIVYLLSKGASTKGLKKSPIIVAAENNNTMLLQQFVKVGVDINSQDKNGISCMHVIVDQRNINSVRTLFETGASLDLQDNRGLSPLFYAVLNRDIEMISLLLELGANVNLIDKSGQTVLMRSVLNGNYDMVKILLEKGANPNIYDYQVHFKFLNKLQYLLQL